MKKTLVALSILAAFVLNTHATFAVCHCKSVKHHRHHHMAMKKHHSHLMRSAHHRSYSHRGSCPTGAACPISSPCGCPRVHYSNPCPAAPCPMPCCD